MRVKSYLLTCAVLFVGCTSLWMNGCGTPTDPSVIGGDGDSPTPSTGGGGNNQGDQPDDSVGDVLGGGGGSPGSNSSESVRARVRNESGGLADVTLRFIRDDVVVHLAFVRSAPDTITTIVSPKSAEQLDLSGIDEQGKALTSRTLRYGVDFDEARVAEYVISLSPSNPAGDSGDVPDVSNPPDQQPGPDVEPTPENPAPPTIALLEPRNNVELTPGATFVVRWEDSSGVASSVVTVGLRPVGGSSSEFVAISPAVGASLDGLNDELRVIVQDVAVGEYSVVARIDDGARNAEAIAPGRLIVLPAAENVAPRMTITSPLTQVEFESDENLTVTWTDEDPDDNATIYFVLIPTVGSDLVVGEFPIGPALAENPDGASADRVVIPLIGVLPGEYDLLGTIDDGELLGTSRVVGVVKVLPTQAPVNDAPMLQIIQPNNDMVVTAGGAFSVTWVDSDANDNARISIMLDPDLTLSPPDGDEIVLAAALSEDEDGISDTILLGIPGNIDPGVYRILGSISDGLTQLVVRAGGDLVVTETEPADDPGADDPLPLPSIAFIEPSDDVLTRVGDSFGLRLSVNNIPYNATASFFVDNSRFGGSARIDVTPADFSLTPNTGSTEFSSVLTIPDDGRVSNNVWPRSFDLEVVVRVGTVDYEATALGTVWIRQEVEVLDVEMINYWCTPDGGGTVNGLPFTGLEIVWKGGGFGNDDEVFDDVRFWLTADGQVPVTGVEDDTHRLLQLPALEGPNQTMVHQIGLAEVLGFEYTRIGNLLILGMALEPGTYHVVPEVFDTQFNRLISHPSVATFEACYPLPNAGISVLP